MNRPPPVHVLHIGKTGGTAIRAALAPVADARGLRLHDHRMTLARVPDGEQAVFFVRDPVTRFVSGFNSRLRMGLPGRHSRHTVEEEIAFQEFRTANELAECLLAHESFRRSMAEMAMTAIGHVGTRLTDVLDSAAYVASRRRDIALFGFQETLERDFSRLKHVLSLPEDVALPGDEIASHRTPPGFDTELSARGRRAIERWYRADIALYRRLREIAARWFGP